MSDRNIKTGEFSEKYTMELTAIRNLIVDLKNSRVYEATGRRGTPKVSTLGKRLEDRVNDLFYKLDNGLPGEMEELAKGLDAVAKELLSGESD